MPFITEEIYHQLQDRKDDLTVKPYPPVTSTNEPVLKDALLLKEVITAIRDARVKAQLKPRETIKLHILSEDEKAYSSILSVLAKQVNAEAVLFTREHVADSITVVVQKDKFYLQTLTAMDTSLQKEQLQKDLEYLRGFLISVDKKLSNEKFVNNAKPEVVEVERKKKADAEAKIKIIQESLRER